MKTTFSKSICSLASLLLALTLTLSCSNDDNPGGSGGGGGSHSGGNNGSFAGNDEYDRYKERLKYYDPADTDQRCPNGVLEGRCEVDGQEVWYNPLTHSCSYDESCYGGPDGGYCERTYYGLGTIELCGSQIYVSSSSRRCVGGVLQRKCGDDWYNRETHYCDYEYDPNTGTETRTLKAKLICGGKYYEPDYSTSWGSDGVVVREPNTRCQNGVVQEKCGGWNGEEPIWYNRETQYCSWDNASQTQTVKPMVLCGGEYIEPDYEKCDSGVVLSRCGGMMGMGEDATWYNYITQICDWNTGTVRDKVRCGS
jgi:hypothetical protein